MAVDTVIDLAEATDLANELQEDLKEHSVKTAVRVFWKDHSTRILVLLATTTMSLAAGLIGVLADRV